MGGRGQRVGGCINGTSGVGWRLCWLAVLVDNGLAVVVV